ncbi:hypothetical protein FRC03_009457 [Tulasnella sp. 419]|nr:hypothetical protein FRC03_009457 [Tulasnella sp. 419]
MECAGLAVGIIPLAFKCCQFAFSIQQICQNVFGGFRAKRDKLCEDICALQEKMLQVEHAKPVGTELENSVKQLKTNLEQLEGDLQSFVSKGRFERLFSYSKIDKALGDAIELVAACEKSFQTSCACYLVKSNEKIQNEVQSVALTTQATDHKADIIVVSVSDIQQQMRELLEARQSDTAPLLEVKVRALGSRAARELSYSVSPTDTVACVAKRMCDENIGIKNIHFFSWSQNRHKLTDTGQDWRYRNKKIGLSTIRQECGRNRGVDVEWWLEFVRSREAFTLFLVHGLLSEKGLIVRHPVKSIMNKLKGAYPRYPQMTIAACQSLEDGDHFDWDDPQALETLTPFTCCLCIRVADRA